MSDTDLLACISRIGRELSAGGVGELASAVESAGSASKLESKADGLPTPMQQKWATKLAAAWATDSEESAQSVALALRAAKEAAAAQQAALQVDLVWTGPKTKEVSVLRNDQALFEIIDRAREDLLVVSAFTWKMPEVVGKLNSAVDRGVRVKLVLEYHDKKGEPTGFNPAKDLGGDLKPEIFVYQWPPDARTVDPKTGIMGYLHVKCAVADGEAAFVSSANLTVYAMETNMELGVVVHGGDVPKRIAAHFEALIDTGVLQRVEG